MDSMLQCAVIVEFSSVGRLDRASGSHGYKGNWEGLSREENKRNERN